MNDLEHRKDESWYMHRHEMSISEMLEKYGLDENEWIYDGCDFENIYDLLPTLGKFRNIKTGQIKVIECYERMED